MKNRLQPLALRLTLTELSERLEARVMPCLPADFDLLTICPKSPVILIAARPARFEKSAEFFWNAPLHPRLGVAGWQEGADRPYLAEAALSELFTPDEAARLQGFLEGEYGGKVRGESLALPIPHNAVAFAALTPSQFGSEDGWHEVLSFEPGEVNFPLEFRVVGFINQSLLMPEPRWPQSPVIVAALQHAREQRSGFLADEMPSAPFADDIFAEDEPDSGRGRARFFIENGEVVVISPEKLANGTQDGSRADKGTAGDVTDAVIEIFGGRVFTDETSLSIKLNNTLTNDSCHLCGGRCDPRGPVDLFADGTNALVCDQCGQKTNPRLMVALKAAQEALQAWDERHGEDRGGQA